MGGVLSGIGNALFGESGQKPQAFRGYGYQDQAKLLNDLLMGQAQTVGSQAAPELSFGSQYNPYQFTNNFNASTAVQDAFTPQAASLQRIFNQRQSDNAGAINTDLERRGLSTSGAASYALGQNRQQTQDALGSALAQLAGTQANSQLQASQFGAQMDFNKQLNQAAELFRNRGASDQQALQMAQYSMQRQQQPIQNLMSLYGLSAGATPGYEASPGLLQTGVGGFAQGAGMAAASGLFCLPKGTKIEIDNGSMEIEDLKVGDYVKGGKIISKSQTLRNDNHKFYKHNFENGSVVMSDGHPYFDDLISLEQVEHDSECTYDILTTKGFYYVNGIKLGSTIKG